MTFAVRNWNPRTGHITAVAGVSRDGDRHARGHCDDTTGSATGSDKARALKPRTACIDLLMEYAHQTSYLCVGAAAAAAAAAGRS